MANAKGKIIVEVEPRTETGKNACRRLRVRGRVPGNVYGLDRPPFMVAVDPRRIEDVLRTGSGQNTIFTLKLGGDKPTTREAMIRELQRDPILDTMTHIDFVRVDLTRAVHVRVPVRLIGTPLGVKNEGGILDFVHREVQVECLPGQIPEHFDVDVSELHLNQNVHVRDLGVSEGVRVLDDPESIVAVVVAPKAEAVAEEEAAVAAPTATGEPEVIRKGKETEPGAKEGS